MDISGTTAIMALNSGWLDEAVQSTSQTTSVGSTSYQCYPTVESHYPWWYVPPYARYVEVASPSRPIKLTLREVERLRDAAQREPALRAILEKFTPQIEVSVSFEER